MTWNDVSQNWTAFSPAILQRWPKLDEVRLQDIDGRRDLMIAEIADKYEQSVSEAGAQIAAWLDGAVPADVITSEHHDNASISDSARELADGETPLDDDRSFGDDAIPARPIGRT